MRKRQLLLAGFPKSKAYYQKNSKNKNILSRCSMLTKDRSFSIVQVCSYSGKLAHTKSNYSAWSQI